MSLTTQDLNQISKLMDKQNAKFDAKVDEIELKFESKLVEFKSEFFDKIDPILKEITTARDERPLIIGRVENLEEIHQEGKHSLPVTQ